MADFLNLPNKEGQDNQNQILQQIANTLGVTTDALNSAVNLANQSAVNAENKITDVENRFQTLTTEQQQDAEVIDARQGKTSLVANIQEFKDEFAAHKAENVSNGVHGLVMETGTFTPTIIGSLVSGSNTYLSNIGKYNRVGNIVFFDISIIMATKDANIDGNLQISGLPFARANDGTRSSVTIGSFNYVTFPSDVLQIGGRVDNGQNKIFLFGQKSNNLAVNVQTTNIANNSAFFISGNYEI